MARAAAKVLEAAETPRAAGGVAVAVKAAAVALAATGLAQAAAAGRTYQAAGGVELCAIRCVGRPHSDLVTRHVRCGVKNLLTPER